MKRPTTTVHYETPALETHCKRKETRKETKEIKKVVKRNRFGSFLSKKEFYSTPLIDPSSYLQLTSKHGGLSCSPFLFQPRWYCVNGWQEDVGFSACTATCNVSSNCPVTYKVTHCQMIRKPNGNPPSDIFLFDFFEAFDFFPTQNR